MKAFWPLPHSFKGLFEVYELVFRVRVGVRVYIRHVAVRIRLGNKAHGVPMMVLTSIEGSTAAIQEG